MGKLQGHWSSALEIFQLREEDIGFSVGKYVSNRWCYQRWLAKLDTLLRSCSLFGLNLVQYSSQQGFKTVILNWSPLLLLNTM